MIEAVIFDLDGVLVDSEQLWDQARRNVVRDRDAKWPQGATEAMQGMSSGEWSKYMRRIPGIGLSADEIVSLVLEKLLGYYRSVLPLNPGAVEAVQRMADRWPLGLASSSNREVIEVVLRQAGLDGLFSATVSSEEVPKGKPAPDVYIETARRLAVLPEHCAAVEDSANGLRSALSAGTCVLALPNPHYPPGPEIVEDVHYVLGSLGDLTIDAVVQADENRSRRIEIRLDEQETESFPASDPHADWAGPI